MKRAGTQNKLQHKGAALLPLLSVLLGTSCTNINVPTTIASPTPAIATSAEIGTTTHKISSVTVNTSGTTSTANINFSKTASTNPITMSCNTASNTAQTSMPCLCQFSWQEVNTSSGSSAPIPHLVQTAVSNVQSYMVVCPAPVYYSTEILNGTTIKVTVVPATNNESVFTVPEYDYVKKASGSTGSAFSDGTNTFDNIYRYTCYEQNKRGMQVKNRVYTFNDTANNSGSIKLVMGSQFCIAGVSSTGAGEGCETIGTPQNSAQSYYYNLYMPSSLSAYNIESSRYICPLVKETLRGTSHTAGEQGDYWPLDTSFSLAVARSTDFPTGVIAFSNLNNGSGDSSTMSVDCNGQKTKAGDLVSRCLGFAAKTNSDGTCKYITDNYGNVHRMFRLRRYVALYPQVFDSNGKLVSGQFQARDVIYVLDRPVSSVNADPKNPFTMLGPKPCPFSYFDHQGVTGAKSYMATNNELWNNTNVDGIEFPSKDDPATYSCAASMPIYNSTTKTFSIVTIDSTAGGVPDKLKKVYVRPIKSWAPNYIEDTSFQACAPQASPKNIDPPLHFYKDTDGNMAWCAEVYPTQNPNITALDSDISTGKVRPFTSHIVNNSASPACSYTSLSLPALYGGVCPGGKQASHCPGAGLADFTKTCDRTVINNGLAWGKFPLLADDVHVESAMGANLATYGCLVTYDKGGSKTGKASPSNGCCGAAVTAGTSQGAHMEPNTTCFEPTY